MISAETKNVPSCLLQDMTQQQTSTEQKSAGMISPAAFSKHQRPSQIKVIIMTEVVALQFIFLKKTEKIFFFFQIFCLLLFIEHYRRFEEAKLWSSEQ